MTELNQILNNIQAEAGAATKGPWEQGLQSIEDSVFCGSTPSHPVARELVTCCYRDRRVANAAFIAHSRTTVPRLCEALKKAIKTIEFYDRWLSVPEEGIINRKQAPIAFAHITDILKGEKND